MPARVTIGLSIDAFDPDRNDTTVNVTDRILSLLAPAFIGMPVVNTDLMSDALTIEGVLAGDFEEIDE